MLSNFIKFQKHGKLITMKNKDVFKKIIKALLKMKMLRLSDLERIIPGISRSNLEVVLGSLISEGIIKEIKVTCNNCTKCTFKSLCPLPKSIGSKIRFYILTEKGKRIALDYQNEPRVS